MNFTQLSTALTTYQIRHTEGDFLLESDHQTADNLKLVIKCPGSGQKPHVLYYTFSLSTCSIKFDQSFRSSKAKCCLICRPQWLEIESVKLQSLAFCSYPPPLSRQCLADPWRDSCKTASHKMTNQLPFYRTLHNLVWCCYQSWTENLNPAYLWVSPKQSYSFKHVCSCHGIYLCWKYIGIDIYTYIMILQCISSGFPELHHVKRWCNLKYLEAKSHSIHFK